MEPTVSDLLSQGSPAPAFSLQPVFGMPVVVGPQCPRTLLLFLRGLDSSHTRSLIEQLHAIHQQLDLWEVAIFTRSNLEDARDFVPRYHVLHRVICDEEGEWYRAYGVEQDRFFQHSLLDLQGWTGAPALLAQGRGKPTSPLNQLPAAFVVAQGIIEKAWYGKSIFALPDLKALTEC
jgi:peroxiredoxin